MFGKQQTDEWARQRQIALQASYAKLEDWEFPRVYSKPIGWVIPKIDPCRRMTDSEASRFNAAGLLRSA